MRSSISLIVVFLAAAVSLGGCASLVGGGTESVAVSTVATSGRVVPATCELTNRKGTSFVVATPDATRVYRDAGVLSVVCTRGGAVIGRAEVKPVVNTLLVSYPSHIVVRVKKVGSMAAMSGAARPAKG